MTLCEHRQGCDFFFQLVNSEIVMRSVKGNVTNVEHLYACGDITLRS